MKDFTTYFAKSKLPNGKQPTVKEHTDLVAYYAAQFGEPLDMLNEAKIAGQFHDFGKYSEDFQDVLHGLKHNVDHAVCGAAFIYSALKPKSGAYCSIIEAINGHHDGLRYIGDIRNSLDANVKQSESITVNDGKYSALCGIEQYKTAQQAFMKDHPGYKLPKIQSGKLNGVSDLQYMLFTRMLFSCLVDADYSVSAWEEDENYFKKSVDDSFDAEKNLESLYEYRNNIIRNSDSDESLNKIRNDLFDICGKCGENSAEGLFTLTAPTGTGKTLALLHFALRHCLTTRKKRIIIVLPFLTLAEQNTNTYEKIIPNVLVDHSQSDISDDAREFTSRWSAPFIITTSVKFFETLFSHKPSDCRKLHNIANSVVVFDEAQSLPPNITATTLQAVNELCRRYHTTMVFSTATQPDFDALPNVDWKPREMMPDNEEMYHKLKRTEVEWRLNANQSLEQIADEMSECDSVCGIFNLRKHARKVYNKLYDMLKEYGEEDSVFLLTTDLCPAHRSCVVEQVKKRLNKGLPCRVVATQCVEAGVDLDFKVLYRVLAPLDSIIQSAGRCNRNGREAAGQVVVFEPDEERLYPDDHYGNSAKLVKMMVSDGGIDINDPNDIRKYYRELFKNAKDKPTLTKALEKRDYKTVDKEYVLIENTGVRVIVPFSENMELYNEAWEDITENGITPAWMKRTASITVTAFEGNTLEEFAEPIYFRIKGRKSEQKSGYYVLRKQHEKCYSDRMGLQFEENNDNFVSIF